LGFEQVKPHAQLLPLQQSTINNQQSSLGNHHSAIINPMEKMQSGGLRTPAGLVPPSGLLRVLVGPQSGGLRTPAEKCRPPG
jgi:hypothetical protein